MYDLFIEEMNRDEQRDEKIMLLLSFDSVDAGAYVMLRCYQ